MRGIFVVVGLLSVSCGDVIVREYHISKEEGGGVPFGTGYAYADCETYRAPGCPGSTFDRGAVMALNNPPDGWEMNAGTWGTDVDESSSVVLSGIRSIHYPSSSSTDPVRMNQTEEKWIPVTEGRSYRGWVVLRADSNSAGEEVRGTIQWREQDGSAISNSDIYNAVVGTVDTWELHEAIFEAPTNAAQARLLHGRDGASFNAYIDDIGMVPAVPQWKVYQSDNTDQSIPGSFSQTAIDFDTASKTVDCSLDQTGDDHIDIEVPGIYQMGAQLALNGWPDATDVHLEFYQNSTRIGGQRYQIYTGGSGTGYHVMSSTVMFELDAGDAMRVYLTQGDGSSQNLDSGESRVFFYGARVE